MINIKNASCTYINRYTILSDILIYITYIYNHIINIQYIYITFIYIQKTILSPIQKIAGNFWIFIPLPPHPWGHQRWASSRCRQWTRCGNPSGRGPGWSEKCGPIYYIYIYIDFIVIYIYIITKKQFEHIWTYLNDFKRISFVWWSNQVMYNVQ